jgi:hypothetical protein
VQPHEQPLVIEPGQLQLAALAQAQHGRADAHLQPRARTSGQAVAAGQRAVAVGAVVGIAPRTPLGVEQRHRAIEQGQAADAAGRIGLGGPPGAGQPQQRRAEGQPPGDGGRGVDDPAADAATAHARPPARREVMQVHADINARAPRCADRGSGGGM